MILNGTHYTRQQIIERIGNPDQLGGLRPVVLAEGKARGLDAIELDTGGGLTATVLPGRGLDISRADYKGTNLVYRSAVGDIHPSFYEPEGLGWLRTFTAGLLTTCGLTYFGPPNTDQGETLGLHGRYSTLPARQVNHRTWWNGDDYEMEISGITEEGALFGDKMRLTRRIRTQLGASGLTIHDTAENIGFQETPLCLLYHINLGFPLLDTEARLYVSSDQVIPRDEHAGSGLEERFTFSPPIPGWEEQCYFYKMNAGANGMAHAALVNPDLDGGLGVCISFSRETLPWLTEWKMVGQGDYVLGVEPGNLPVMSRNSLRQEGMLETLTPGETRDFQVHLDVLEGQEAIAPFLGDTQ